MSIVAVARTEDFLLEPRTSGPVALGAAAIRVRIANPYTPTMAHVRAMLAGARGVSVMPRPPMRIDPHTSLAAPDVVIAELAAADRSPSATVRDLTRGAASTGVLVIGTCSDGEWIRAALDAGAAGVISASASREALVLAVQAVASGQIVLPRRAVDALMTRARSGDDRAGPSDRLPMRASTGDRGHGLARLTGREHAVFRLIAEGYSAPEIGTRLSISKKTVETYKRRIGDKLGLCHRSDYVRLALEEEVLVAPRFLAAD